MPTATVPEAAVHKDGDAFATKHKIGLAWQRLLSPPAFDSVRA